MSEYIFEVNKVMGCLTHVATGEDETLSFSRMFGYLRDNDDNVNHPSHYTQGEVECIDGIRSALGHEKFVGYLWGNAMKYVWRWEHKGMVEDLRKAMWYIERLIEEVEDAE